MDKFFFTILLWLSICFNLFSQAPPQAFNYSAVARDSQGQPISNGTIGIQISIIQSSVSGTVVYQENHIVDTDSYGLFNLIVGGGSVQLGNMLDIDWGIDKFFLQTGMDINGMTNFVIMGTTQLLSVPYALYAKTAETLVNDINSFSGDYNDLINAPDNVSSFYNDVGYISNLSVSSDGDTLFFGEGRFIIIPGVSSANYTLPVVYTSSVNNITSNSAQIVSNVENDGGSIIIEKGVVWSTNSSPTLLSNNGMTNDGDGIGIFNSEITNLLDGTTYYVRAFATNINGTAYGNEQVFNTLYCQDGLCIGDTYEGGIIAYFLQAGDFGYDVNIPHGILIAPVDQTSAIEWGCYSDYIGSTSEDIGYGNQNTIAIVNACSESDFAAKICNDLILNGYSDWYLPSINELSKIYENLYLYGIGNLTSSAYWSSTEYSVSFAFYYDFDTGLKYPQPKDGQVSIRAVRHF
jgi:hypothetical protein